MRFAVLSALLLPGCLHTAALNAPVKAPPTGPAQALSVEFAPSGADPTKLYVCQLQEGGTLWCLDYEVFLSNLAAQQQKPSDVL